MHATRREALLSALFGAGYVGLRALATGLPASLLLNPLAARADACAGPRPQYLIWSTSYLGDPLNGNVPGTWEDPLIMHPPSLPTGTLTIGGRTYGAGPWSSLPPDIAARTSFFHHTTLNIAHGNEPKVLKLMGAVQRQEMLLSLIAANNAPCLGTVQAGPVALGTLTSTELLSFKGRTMPTLTPTALRDLLLGPTKGPQGKANTLVQPGALRAQRDQDLSALNALYKQHGTAAQRAFLDQMAQSQTDLRALSLDILNGLSSITDNGPTGQVTAALLLIRMNVTPVISIHIPWGGDNHNDANLVGEAAQTVAGVGTVISLQQQLQALGLQDQVTFVCMNVFGRTMSIAHKGYVGRDHQANHHCALLIGKGVRGSVIGGVVPAAGDYSAQSIDSVSGAGVSGTADIPFAQTLGAVGKTICAAAGVSSDVYNTQITTGKVVTAALSS